MAVSRYMIYDNSYIITGNEISHPTARSKIEYTGVRWIPLFIIYQRSFRLASLDKSFDPTCWIPNRICCILKFERCRDTAPGTEIASQLSISPEAGGFPLWGESCGDTRNISPSTQPVEKGISLLRVIHLTYYYGKKVGKCVLLIFLYHPMEAIPGRAR